MSQMLCRLVKIVEGAEPELGSTAVGGKCEIGFLENGKQFRGKPVADIKNPT